MKKSVFLIFALLTTVLLRGQDYPKDYFRSPVDFRILLSGTFGELRSGHFHSGIDIKTNGHTGAKIYAVADGYVSRIKVSTFGFGKTLYVTHPNGYVSVYAHLSKFKSSIAGYIKEQHYANESFELNVFPDKDMFPVKKGEVIAYSGNSGSSAGPHLHFEIRKEASQKPVNALLFGIDVKDYIRPKITGLMVYPADDTATVNGRHREALYIPDGWGEVYRVPGNDTIMAFGNISFGIRTYDLLNDASNKNGVYSIALFQDSEPIYFLDVEEFSFSETRYINSLIDYKSFVEKKTRFQRSRVDPNNKLNMYGDVKDRGIVSISDGQVRKFEYVVKDIRGNTSVLTFHVKGREPVEKKYVVSPARSHEQFFYYDRANVFQTADMIFDAPENAFYDSFTYTYENLPPGEHMLSDIHRAHEKTTPIHAYCKLSIRPVLLPDSLEDKVLLAIVTDDGKLRSAGGTYKDGYVSGRIRSFGDYCVTIDTIAPEIIQRDKGKNANLAGRKSIRFMIEDDFSGIKSDEGTLNGEWLLLEYDAKKKLLVYHIDERLRPGDNPFKLMVSDHKDNITIYETILHLGK